MMHNSNTLPLSALNNAISPKMKERSAFNQVITSKAASMERIIQVVHRVAQKSCRRACQLICCPVGIAMCDKVTYCPAENHPPTEDKTTQVAHWSPPSTVLIVNISNSTLVDCAIGNDTYSSVVVERQPLMQESKPQMHDETVCSCKRRQQGAAQYSPPPPPPPSPLPSGAEPPSINIHSSNLNYVIIGDNNYMHAERTLSTETEELQL